MHHAVDHTRSRNLHLCKKLRHPMRWNRVTTKICLADCSWKYRSSTEHSWPPQLLPSSRLTTMMKSFQFIYYLWQTKVTKSCTDVTSIATTITAKSHPWSSSDSQWCKRQRRIKRWHECEICRSRPKNALLNTFYGYNAADDTVERSKRYHFTPWQHIVKSKNAKTMLKKEGLNL